MKVPRKNISHRVTDIKIQGEKIPEPKIPEALKEEKPAEPAIVDTTPPKSEKVEKHLLPPPRFNPIWAWLAAVVILLGGLYVLWPKDNSNQSASASDEIPTQQASVNDWQKLTSLTSQLGEAAGSFGSLTSGTIGLLQEMVWLQDQGVVLFLSGKGEELLSHLDKVRQYLEDIYKKGDFWEEAANSATAGGQSVRPGDVLALHVSVGQVRDFLAKLVPWLSDPAEKHLILFLENPSELRPGGGFLGSYADMVISSGAMKSISVHDINEPDRLIDSKTVPPKPLQAIMSNWRAADSNWFFDFSDSARKTIGFMSSSTMYKDANLVGAVGISAQVVEGLLGLTDPISVASGTLEIRPDNFLYKIQGEVQKGQAQKAAEPKKILQELAPILMDRLVSLDKDKKSQLSGMALRWLETGDLRLYFTDSDFQKFAESMNAAGRMYEVRRDWNGAYLGFASANIGGGKTDIFIDQTVSLETQISSEGWLNDHIVISRKHTASSGDPWWYRETNKSFFQIFTNPATNLSYADGGSERKITPKVNYLREKYQTDPDVEAIEKAEKQLDDYPSIKTYAYRDKKIFSTWLNVDAGKTVKFMADLNRRAVAVPEEGMSYEFVLEKQSGDNSQYFWQITAPVGFKFKENNLPVYEYKTADAPERWSIRLTLQKI